MTVYRVGIIGCGRIASLLEQESRRGNPNTHAGCYDYCDRTQIVAAADANPQRREAFGKRWGVTSLYIDWQDMIQNEDLDIISVCTYPIPHRDMVIAAASSGAKAIFCEKAMATTLREADEMVDVCRQNKVVLSINHTRRWDWQCRQVKDILQQERIGTLRAITLHFSAGLANNGTHYFDLLRFFAGDVRWAVGHLVDPDSLDPSGSGYFHFENDVQCLVNGSSGAGAQFLYELIGNKGRITIANTRPCQFQLWVDGKMADFPSIPANQQVNTIGMGRCVIPLSVEELIEALDHNRDTISTGEDGRAALEMVLALHESERQGNVRVDFPMQSRDLQVLVRPDNFISTAVPQNI